MYNTLFIERPGLKVWPRPTAFPQLEHENVSKRFPLRSLSVGAFSGGSMLTDVQKCAVHMICEVRCL